MNDRIARVANPRVAAILILAFVLLGGGRVFGGDIHDAVFDGDLEKVKTLLKASPDLISSKNPDGDTPLHFAAYKGNIDICKLLLENKADINALDQGKSTPLSLAARGGHKAVVELLLANKADINGGDALREAVTTRHQDVAELLLAGNAKCDIFIAAAAGGLEKVKQLLKADPKLASATDDDLHNTALHMAAKFGQKKVVDLMLANNADINVRNSDGMTPLHLAAENTHPDIVELLLVKKADVNAADREKMTPLHEAAFIGDEKIAAMLLANKADVNAVDSSGRRPLDWAMPSADGSMILPDHTRRDCWTRSKKDVLEGRPAVVELLRQHGGKATGDGKTE